MGEDEAKRVKSNAVISEADEDQEASMHASNPTDNPYLAAANQVANQVAEKEAEEPLISTSADGVPAEMVEDSLQQRS